MWKFIGITVAGLLIAALAVSLFLQRQSSERVKHEIRQLRAQLDQLKADQLSAQKQSAGKILTLDLPPAQQPSLEPKELTELLQLRNEVASLRDKEKARQESLRKRRETAEILLVRAEKDFARLTNLYAQQLVSSQVVARARLSVDWMRAEAKGNWTEAAQIRLRQAETRFEHVAELYRQRLASEAEYTAAKADVDAFRAELGGDDAQMYQIRLHEAEEELARATDLRARSLISETDYDAARRKVDLLRTQAKQ